MSSVEDETLLECWQSLHETLENDRYVSFEYPKTQKYLKYIILKQTAHFEENFFFVHST